MQLRVSELFSSFQGEGASLGVPSVFLRLALCNLRCHWCDTKYTWDFKQYKYAEEVAHWPLLQALAEVERALAEPISKEDSIRISNLIETDPPLKYQGLALPSLQAHPKLKQKHLVLTGGEPLIQAGALAALLDGLPPDLYVEIETNGTLAPPAALQQRVQQWNVSPKLAHGGDPLRRRLVPQALGALRDTERAWLKLVIERAEDLAEVERLLELCAWPRERVLLMPQATKPSLLAERSLEVARLAAEAGLGFSSRLHVALWGERRGV